MKRYWFLIALVITIGTGLKLGFSDSSPEFKECVSWIDSRLITALVLFLMSFSLKSHFFLGSLKSPKPVLWAASINYGLIPLLAWPLMSFQLMEDFSLGLMIASSVPCSLAAVSVWTRRAEGNDAISLLVTLVTNALCFLVTPFWLSVATAKNVQLDGWEMVFRLLGVALIPMILGQVCQISSKLDELGTRHKIALGTIAQCLILVLVLAGTYRAGQGLIDQKTTPDLITISLVWGSCIFLHLFAMGVGILGAKLMHLCYQDQIAVAFASSQKTLPIGILLATDPATFGTMSWAIFPMLMYHTSQLFIDTLIADRFRHAQRAAQRGQS